MLKGLNYRSPSAYKFLTKILLGRHVRDRFEIAASLLAGCRSVLDLCAGTGELRRYLPQGCAYTAWDASPEFIAYLRRHHVRCALWTFEATPEDPVETFDAVVMLISLYQILPYDAGGLIERFKKLGRKVVIVEDVSGHSIAGAFRNYFCSRDYYRPCGLMSRNGFESLMTRHGFNVRHHGERYSSAVFEKT